MPTPEQIIKKINKIVDSAPVRFSGEMSKVQKKLLEEIITLSKSLDASDGRIKASVANLKYISTIVNKLRRVVFNDTLKTELNELAKAFTEISRLNNQYFSLIERKFKPTPLMEELRVSSIENTIDGLKEVIEKNTITRIKNVLIQNITSQASYFELGQVFKGFLGETTGRQGILEPTVKTLVITSVGSYSRNYTKAASTSLGWEWFRYVGSNITTTRCFCHAMTKKEYFHISEVPRLIQGDFEEYKARGCDIDPKTDLPEGMIAGTNPSNFFTNAGGWNCGHGIYPVPDYLVPKTILKKFSQLTAEEKAE